ncbi:MAG: hypothetical protein ACRCS3_05835 [Paracoccaceae bacterium]
MQLASYFPSETNGFDEGAKDFLQLLRKAQTLPIYQGAYDSFFGDPFDKSNRFLDEFRAENQSSPLAGEVFDIHAGSPDDGRPNITFDYTWGKPSLTLTYLTIDFNNPPPFPILLRDVNRYIETVDTIISWKRPQHVRCGPAMYFLNDHPLDKARSGIGWLGWVPFDLSPADVPEAAIVLPIQGGTFVASQRDWWIAAGPQRDEAAVRRAQALELRLNVLGVLPTNIELGQGNWGQGGLRP